MSSDDRDCEHLMEFVNGNKRSPTGTSDRNLHLITTIDKDDLSVCGVFFEENVEMVLDSASTEHIFNINECFFTAIEPSRASVLTGGGKITAVAKGNVELFLTNEDDEEDRVEIPNMPVNILSISKLAKNGITADFNNEECVLTLTREKKAVAYFIAEQRRGLYILKGRLANPPTDRITLLSHSKMKDLVYTFHNSQNHMPLRHLKERIRAGVYDSMLTPRQRRLKQLCQRNL